MNFINIREGALKDIFNALEEAFDATGVDYYIIGALAKDIWYAKGDVISRKTKDVDFAVLVGSQENYNVIREYLKEKKMFFDAADNPFVIFSPSGNQIDILPFGGVEIDESVTFAKETSGDNTDNGFMNVYKSGTNEVALETGHQFNVATLPSIVLLKLISFDDRPEIRFKDARDIADIIHHFFDLHATLIYSEEYKDLFGDGVESKSLQEISSTVIGRKIDKIIASNSTLRKRITKILQCHIEQKE